MDKNKTASEIFAYEIARQMAEARNTDLDKYRRLCRLAGRRYPVLIHVNTSIKKRALAKA